MSQRPRRYRTKRRACVDLSARVDPETGKVRSTEYEDAAIEDDPISHDSFPSLEQWPGQMVYCPECFKCFTRDSYGKFSRMYTDMGRKLHCPLCNKEIDEMRAYGKPAIPEEEKNRQDDEIRCYKHHMQRAICGMEYCLPRPLRNKWYREDEPKLLEKMQKGIDKGRKAMTDAYEAGNPGGSYFEARNRRWEEYNESIIWPAEEQETTCHADLWGMRHNRIRIEVNTIIPDGDKEDIFSQMDEFIRRLEEAWGDADEFLTACKEWVYRKILFEGQD